MKKETVLLVVVTLIVGLLVGIIVSKGGKRSVGTPAGVPSVVDSRQNLALLEEIVVREPTNRGAWVQLGNLYFGADQPIKAVEAYAKALELNPRDPNVLTDQGTMFRSLGWYDRAIENFEQAQKIDPMHPQSLFNLGVVYRYDLNDFPRAHEAWSRYVELFPTSPGAERLGPELEFLRAQPESPQWR